jgi:3-hydroxybutyryl-CoA dehydrogenase
MNPMTADEVNMFQENLSILGSGTMGHSIALSAALAGFSCRVWGNSDADISRGRQDFQEKLDVLQKYEVIELEERSAIQERVEFTVSIEDCVREATFIIEAVPENLELKQGLYENLDSQCSKNIILASNTSGLSPTLISARMAYPERMVVTHFWNPGHLIPLVEIVRGEKTDDSTVTRALNLLKKMNKKPIVVNKDILGSIGNRLQYALFREAQYILEQGAASIEDIDAAVRYSIGRRLPVTGPFASADMGGLDVFDSISNYLFPDLCKEQTSLHTMRTLVNEGKYGQKTGSGFYNWSKDFSKRMNEERERELIEWLKKDLLKIKE